MFNNVFTLSLARLCPSSPGRPNMSETQMCSVLESIFYSWISLQVGHHDRVQPHRQSSVGVRCPPSHPPLLKSTTIVPNVDQEGEGATLMHHRERKLEKVSGMLNTTYPTKNHLLTCDRVCGISH